LCRRGDHRRSTNTKTMRNTFDKLSFPKLTSFLRLEMSNNVRSSTILACLWRKGR
jgi:hypothetical protein